MLGQSYWNDDGSPVAGTGDAAQRLREQDFDGIDAEVLYPPVFISRYIANIADKDAYLAMVRAYNTFLAEDYCSVAPDRLIGNAVIPITGTEDAIAEMKRVKSLGLRSICLSQFPAGDASPSTDDDVFWHAALESGMSITAHGGLGDRMSPLMVASATGRFDMVTALVSRTIPGPANVIAQMAVSGTFDRIPELRIYLAETNASWMPAVFFMMDDSYALFRDWYGVDLAMKPSEYARRQLPLRDRPRSACARDARLPASRGPHVGIRLPPLGNVLSANSRVARHHLRGRRRPSFDERSCWTTRSSSSASTPPLR